MVGGSPASSTTKTGCHDIAEILLKVALNTINQIYHAAPSVTLYLFESRVCAFYSIEFLLENTL
jgi:hypothetical protein